MLLKTLFVGKSCLDSILYTNGFPIEDSDVRLANRIIRGGGNVLNSAVVLSHLNNAPNTVYLLTYFSYDENSNKCKEYLAEMNVDISLSQHLVFEEGYPETILICPFGTTSKTTMHKSNKFPLISSSTFAQTIAIKDFDWVHFEGRNLGYAEDRLESSPLWQMLVLAIRKPKLRVSLEFKKIRISLERSEPFLRLSVDILLIGNEFAQSFGWKNPEETVKAVASKNYISIIACYWPGIGSACFVAKTREFFQVEQNSVTAVVDPIGDGDTFNAAFLHQIQHSNDAQKALNYASFAAAEKIKRTDFRVPLPI